MGSGLSSSIAAMVGVLALAGCGQATQPVTGQGSASASAPASPSVSALATSTAATQDGEVHSKAEAQARAEADLAAVHLPLGVVARPTAPSPRLTLAPETTAVQTLVDAARWATVPGTVQGVTAYVSSHPPYGLMVGGSSSGSDQVSALIFRRPVDGADSGHDEIDVSFVQDGSSVDVRVDAQVIWLPPKSSFDTIAAGQTSAQLAYYPGLGGSPGRTVTVTGPRLTELIAALNALKVLPPGPPWSCPMDTGEHAVLTPSTHGHTQAFTIALMGCGFVTVKVDGRPGDTLTGDSTAQDLVRGLVGAEPSPSQPPGATARPSPTSSSR